MTIKAVLFDLSGVLYTGNSALPGALDALQKLTSTTLPIRYITNTTRSTRSCIISNLASMGFAIKPDDLFTAPSAICDYLKHNQLSPHLVVHPDLEAEFSDRINDGTSIPNAVVMGDAGTYFTYEKLNSAFRYLMEGAPFLVMGINRYFKESDELSLDMGPFVKALEYAADTKATVFGKPAATFYQTVVNSTGQCAEETIMIGDDIQSDIIGAIDAGLQGILVKTGKYRQGDELALNADQYKTKGHCLEDVSTAVDYIFKELYL